MNGACHADASQGSSGTRALHAGRGARTFLRTLAPDDAADIIQRAPAKIRPRLLSALDAWPRAEVSALLAYKEDEAGGLMSPRFARLRPEVGMDEAIAYLRRQAGQVETIYEAYVLDSDQRLLGVVSLHDLLSAAKTQTVKTVMRTRFKSVRSDERQEAIEKPIADHRLLAVPVVDAGGAMQATRSGAGRDMQKVGGMAALGAPYLDTPLRNML